jgi:hypothetical protein
MYCVKMQNMGTFTGIRKHATKQETELEFLKSLWGLGTEEEEVYLTGPPGYIGWRNPFLGFDSGAPYTFKKYGLRRGRGDDLYYDGGATTPATLYCTACSAVSFWQSQLLLLLVYK